jgi:predicted kinase
VNTPRATLYIFSGLPGTGKTTLARMLASRLDAAYIRIDTIEQALRNLCNIQVEAEGYRLAYKIAEDNLKAGLSVVADSCNPITITRDDWENVARLARAGCKNIEIICSDAIEHQRRVESRIADIAGHQLPTWNDVVNREYHAWDRPRIIVDTSGKSAEAALEELLASLAE